MTLIEAARAALEAHIKKSAVAETNATVEQALAAFAQHKDHLGSPRRHDGTVVGVNASGLTMAAPAGLAASDALRIVNEMGSTRRKRRAPLLQSTTPHVEEDRLSNPSLAQTQPRSVVVTSATPPFPSESTMRFRPTNQVFGVFSPAVKSERLPRGHVASFP